MKFKNSRQKQVFCLYLEYQERCFQMFNGIVLGSIGPNVSETNDLKSTFLVGNIQKYVIYDQD